MARSNKALPKWFELDRYREATELDAGEWLLNLLLRGWIARTQDPFGVSVVQGPRPILRRGDEEQVEAFQWHFWGKPAALAAAPAGLLDLLKGRSPKSGIDPLTVEGLYIFERRLPEPVRKQAARCLRESRLLDKDDELTMRGRLDHAFSPQMSGRFVRVNLALPDSVLLQDLADFLRRERADLAKLGGPHPFQEAVRTADKTRPKVKTWANIGLLPFLDLQRWANKRESPPTDYEMAGLIGTEPNRMSDVRDYAERCMQDMIVRAWLEPLARGITTKRKLR